MKSSMLAQETPSSSKALSQYAAQRDELLHAYFRDTKLLQVLQGFLTKLARDFKTRRVLPANPYPRLLQLIRRSEIERSLALSEALTTATRTTSGTQPDFLLHEQQQQKSSNASISSASSKQIRLCTTKELLARSLWGFLPVMERLDLTQLGRRVDAIREIHPSWFAVTDDGNLMGEQDDEGYVVTVFGALVGHGNSFALAEYPIVKIEQHVVVVGELLEKAMAVFARRLFIFLYELVMVSKASKSSDSSEPKAAIPRGAIGCRGICITTMSGSAGDSVSGLDDDRQQLQQLWTVERVNGNRNAFVSAVKLAIVSNASFGITSFSEPASTLDSTSSTTNSSSITVCETTQRFFFHFVSKHTNKTVKASVTQHQEQNRSFMTGTRALESGVFLSARGALEIATRVQNAMALTSGATNSNGKNAPTKAQAGKKSSEIRPSEPNSMQNQLISNQNLHHATGVMLIENVFGNLQRHTSFSPDVFRQWTKRFASSIAFALLQIVLRNQVLVDLLETLEREAGVSGSATAYELLEAHFAATSSQMSALLEQARVGSSSSLLKSVEAVLRTLWRKGCTKFELLTTASNTSDDSGDRDSEPLIEQLQRGNELLLVVARIAIRDFVKLVQSHHSDAEIIELGSDEHPTLVDPDEHEIDVLRALQVVVEEREYPPLIAFECVFAQFLVDSCVDVAFESAVMNIVSFHLPPNPFIELSLKMRVFTVRHHVWASPLEQGHEADGGGAKRSKIQMIALNSETELAVILKLDSNDPSRNLYGSNRKILEILDPDRVWTAHSWFQSHRIFRQQDFQSSKGSYSVQTFHSLLVSHPLAGYSKRTNQPVLQELEVLEHVVVEGREFTQALAFFAEAVVQDLRRLSGRHSSPHLQDLPVNPMEANLVGPLGEIVSDVDYLRNDDNEVMHQLLQEASRAKCVLQLEITLFSEPQSLEIGGVGGGKDNTAVVHIVRKSYVFHHKPTENGGDDNRKQINCVSQLLVFRIQQFGIFFRSENAVYVLGECVGNVLATGDDCGLAREHWTPFARQATEHDDLLLKYELGFGGSSDATAADFSAPYHHRADHTSGLLLQQLTAHSSMLQLYSIETACRWLLEHLQQRLRDVQQSRVRPPALASPSQLPLKALILILEMLFHQLEETLRPLNTQMRYVEGLNELLAALRQTLSSLKSSSSSTTSPAPLKMSISNSVNSVSSMILPDVVCSLRQTWLLVLYVRFSYQQDFFASY